MPEQSDKERGHNALGKKPIAAVALAVIFCCSVLFASRHIFSAASATPIASSTLAAEIVATNEATADWRTPQAAAAASQIAAAAFTHTYTDPTYEFSFQYPDSLTLGDWSDPLRSGTTTTIIVQNLQEHVFFQIYISPWTDPDIPLTAALLEQDLPDIDTHNFQAVTVAGAQGISFSASFPNTGDSMQVWFVRDGTLYQISTYAAEMPLLSKILSTWHFTNGV